jgi:hypothetical protein
MLRGYRKLLMFIVLAGLAAFVDISDTQADVLITLAIAGLGSNAAVHGARSISEAMAIRSGHGSGVNTGNSLREE